MKNILNKHFWSLSVLMVLNQIVVAKRTSDFSPAASNILGAEYPKVSGDNSLHVRLRAPEANKVQVQGGDGLFFLKKSR